MNKPYLDAYKDLESVPTRQDVSNLEAHFNRRNALMRTLGLVPSHLSGKRIIEFGPGSGENSIFFASLNPQHYTLVDGTESSIKSVNAHRARHYPKLDVNIIKSDFFDFSTEERFDAVFCEGAIPTQRDPARLLRHISGFVEVGGILVMTCQCAVSFLPETIRWLLARLHIGQPILDLSHVSRLLEFFRTDLDCLTGMSRRREDWVIDQIIRPGSNMGSPFSIMEAIDCLEAMFSPHGTSPRFCVDWRWYKSMSNRDDGFADVFRNCYWEQLHNFFDWRHVLPAADPKLNEQLLHCSNEIYHEVFNMELGRTPFDHTRIETSLTHIVQNCPQLHGSTRSAIQSVIKLLNSKDYGSQSHLLDWWGRGQQYLSFIRTK